MKSLPIDTEEEPVNICRSVDHVEGQIELLIGLHIADQLDLVAPFGHIVDAYGLAEVIVNLKNTTQGDDRATLLDDDVRDDTPLLGTLLTVLEGVEALIGTENRDLKLRIDVLELVH